MALRHMQSRIVGLALCVQARGEGGGQAILHRYKRKPDELTLIKGFVPAGVGIGDIKLAFNTKNENSVHSNTSIG